MRESSIKTFYSPLNLYIKYFALANLAVTLCKYLPLLIHSVAKTGYVLFCLRAIAKDN